MKITIKLFATLREGLFNKKTVEFAEGCTVEQIIKELSIPREKVSIIFVNNCHEEMTHRLSDGDEVGLFPLVGGG